jgi:rare lipoprotein A (peptidoglycan hydrolase)
MFTAILVAALLAAPSAVHADATDCSTVRASTYNDYLKVRRTLTGNEQKFAHRPVCQSAFRRLKKSVRKHRRKCIAGMNTSTASWYGPGFYGRTTASGTTLTTGTIGVAHKSMPFGTQITFKYGKRMVRASVIDRGPYVHGREFDLTGALKNALGFGSVDTIRWSFRDCAVKP